MSKPITDYKMLLFIYSNADNNYAFFNSTTYPVSLITDNYNVSGLINIFSTSAAYANIYFTDSKTMVYRNNSNLYVRKVYGIK